MAKQKTAFVCNDCGSDYAKWQGQCNDCGAWNTLAEVKLGPARGSGRPGARVGAGKSGFAGALATAQVLKDIDLDDLPRFSSGAEEFDRVLGGASYPRIRFGVGAVPRLMNQADWVLSRFMDEEREDVKQGVQTAADAVEACLGKGVTLAANEFNKKVASEQPPEHPNEKKPNQANQDTNETQATNGDES